MKPYRIFILNIRIIKNKDKINCAQEINVKYFNKINKSSFLIRSLLFNINHLYDLYKVISWRFVYFFCPLEMHIFFWKLTFFISLFIILVQEILQRSVWNILLFKPLYKLFFCYVYLLLFIGVENWKHKVYLIFNTKFLFISLLSKSNRSTKQKQNITTNNNERKLMKILFYLLRILTLIEFYLTNIIFTLKVT